MQLFYTALYDYYKTSFIVYYVVTSKKQNNKNI